MHNHIHHTVHHILINCVSNTRLHSLKCEWTSLSEGYSWPPSHYDCSVMLWHYIGTTWISTKCQPCSNCVPLTLVTFCWHFPLATYVSKRLIERDCFLTHCRCREQPFRALWHHRSAQDEFNVAVIAHYSMILLLKQVNLFSIKIVVRKNTYGKTTDIVTTKFGSYACPYTQLNYTAYMVKQDWRLLQDASQNDTISGEPQYRLVSVLCRWLIRNSPRLSRWQFSSIFSAWKWHWMYYCVGNICEI